METNAVFLNPVRRQLRIAPAAVLAALAVLLAAFCGSAAAKRHSLVGGDGKIHACYRVKGKPKGALRVVRSPRAHCRRGERKVAWSVAAGSSAPGSGGQAGSEGQAGAGGASGTSPSEAALKAQIGALSLKVESLENLLAGLNGGDLSGLLGRVNSLEGVLEGVDNEGLTHAVGAVQGLSGTELAEAVGSVALLDEVCSQTEELTGRSNALLGFLDTLDALNVLSLPVALPAFTSVCPAP